jgi:hypothetical protein
MPGQLCDQCSVGLFEFIPQQDHLFLDLIKDFLGVLPLFTAHGLCHINHPFNGGHPDLEKFILVIGVNTQETESFDKGDIRIHGFLQNPLVESKPAQFPVYDAVLFCHGNPLLLKIVRRF